MGSRKKGEESTFEAKRAELAASASLSEDDDTPMVLSTDCGPAGPEDAAMSDDEIIAENLARGLRIGDDGEWFDPKDD